MSRGHLALRALAAMLLIAAATLASIPRADADATYTVSGHLTQPIPGAVGFVSVLTDQSGIGLPPHGSFVTGGTIAADGSFSLQVPTGTYNFSFDGQGDQPTSFPPTFDVMVLDVAVTGDLELNPVLTARSITLDLVGTDGSPRSGYAELTCEENAFDGSHHNAVVRRVTSSATGTGELTLQGLAIPADNDLGCQVVVYPDDGSFQYQRLLLSSTEENYVTAVIPDAVTLSGTVATSEGPATQGEINEIFIGNSVQRATNTDLPLNPDGTYSVRLAPGTYRITFSGGSTHQSFQLTDTVDVTQDRTYNPHLPTVPVIVHLVDANGQPTAGSVSLFCGTNQNAVSLSGTLHSEATGTGHVLLTGLETLNGYANCFIGSPDDPSLRAFANIGASGGSLTLVVPTGELSEGGPPVDDDGVADAVEALAPNQGDGNQDGTPDYEQQNVTSLPANGASATTGAAFLTVAGPPGSTLTEVSTLDPGNAAVQPPAGVTLPAGLVSFVLKGVTLGSSQTVSVYGGSTAGVNGYAKYDPGAGTWSTLSADRVHVFTDHVDITLTDGGTGDDDGVVNGEISDPGGMAVVAASTDTSRPVVTGVPTTRPNANGWYRDNVRIDWTATDTGSGVAAQPSDTVVTGQGGNLTATSPLVCDKAPSPNCARGSVTGLKIDRTDPTVTINGVTNGATYTLGSVPAPSCNAFDGLSGLNGACHGVRVGGSTSGVGQLTYAASAVDKAGNPRLVSATYRVVYRFDGFLPPLNDPASPMSVFPAGSTVPVAFVLERADGHTAMPSTRPVWVIPVRGVRTSAPVNEAAVSGPGTSASSYAWRNGRWQHDWSTRGLASGYVYRVGVRLDDGTTHYLNVALR